MIRISAFSWVPPFAQGLVRDFRVRWALEEAGLAYDTHLVGPEDLSSGDYRAQQPFGQVPVFEEDGRVLFESGAIVLHIAERSESLMPRDAHARARVTSWLIAALNSVEPQIQELALIDFFYQGEEWAKLRRPTAVQSAQARLDDLSTWLDGRDYLEGGFTAADLIMTTVLRILRETDLLAQMPVLETYRLRCEARPAFQKAMADHMAPFAQNKPA